MSIDVPGEGRIEMSQRERDVLKVMYAVLKGERTQAEASGGRATTARRRPGGVPAPEPPPPVPSRPRLAEGGSKMDLAGKGRPGRGGQAGLRAGRLGRRPRPRPSAVLAAQHRRGALD